MEIESIRNEAGGKVIIQLWEVCRDIDCRRMAKEASESPNINGIPAYEV